MYNKYHVYHLVNPSPWPILVGLSLLTSAVGVALWFNFYEFGENVVILGLGFNLFCVILWWRDIIREGTFQGHHTKVVQKGLVLGMVLFIVSEVCLFVSFFWTYFHVSLIPSIEIGGVWPPIGIQVFDPLNIPLLNTLILLMSGCSVTWSHNEIVLGNKRGTIISLLLTLLLGVLFSLCQLYEYIEATYTIADSIYGSVFYLITGFHGLHVIVGTLFLSVSFVRIINYHFTKKHHFGFEAAIWYWHFVDVVWLFVYVFLYWWVF
uniref:Cytochrome c oxidase subunit 3 n=1 Tax=Sphaerothecum destruens TaxID=42893 RepID=A0A6H2U3G0_9EUKA|nr:cytochrome c oxidase subunit III [Sphaerothecum destruens]QID02699.1 cytochrome c oxidase subunit III [Sphaerothecum destruens]